MLIIDVNGRSRECRKAYPDPSYPGYVKAEFKNERGSYCEWYPINVFLEKNPNFSPDKGEELNEIASEKTGIVTSTTDLTLTDTSQEWKENSYSGFPLWISVGKGEGQVRKVVSNTDNTLVLDKKWEIKPNKFSHYVLSYSIHKNMPAFGNLSPEEIQDKNEKEAKKMDKEKSTS